MDPPGFALENFDAIGGWRERYRGEIGDAPQTEVPRSRNLGIQARSRRRCLGRIGRRAEVRRHRRIQATASRASGSGSPQPDAEPARSMPPGPVSSLRIATSWKRSSRESSRKTAVCGPWCTRSFKAKCSRTSNLPQFMNRKPHEPFTLSAFPRRKFLKGAGVALALPLLDAFLPRARGATVRAPSGTKMVCICTSLGLHAPFLFPEETGADYTLTPYLGDPRGASPGLHVVLGVVASRSDRCQRALVGNDLVDLRPVSRSGRFQEYGLARPTGG